MMTSQFFQKRYRQKTYTLILRMRWLNLLTLSNSCLHFGRFKRRVRKLYGGRRFNFYHSQQRLAVAMLNFLTKRRKRLFKRLKIKTYESYKLRMWVRKYLGRHSSWKIRQWLYYRIQGFFKDKKTKRNKNVILLSKKLIRRLHKRRHIIRVRLKSWSIWGVHLRSKTDRVTIDLKAPIFAGRRFTHGDGGAIKIVLPSYESQCLKHILCGNFPIRRISEIKVVGGKLQRTAKSVIWPKKKKKRISYNGFIE